MKKLLILSVAFSLYSGVLIFSQDKRFERKFPDRYKLDLPLEWNKPKLIKAITDILPKTLEEIKDKDICSDCEAGYTVMLVVDSPLIKNRNNISKGFSGNEKYFYTAQVIFQFRATLGLFDSTGKEVTELVLVSQEEEHVKREDFSVSTSFTPQIIYDKYGKILQKIYIPSPPVIPISNRIPVSLFDLINIAEQRVYQVRDILAKLN